MKFLILGFIIGLFGKSLAGPVQLDNTNCTICELLVDVIGLSLDNTTVEDCVELVIQLACEAFKIADHRVCQGMVSGLGDEEIYIIKALIKEDPRNLCGFLPLGCGYKFDPKGFRWPLVMPGLKPQHEDVPSPPVSLTLKHSDTKVRNQTIKVLHLSDLHIDNHYSPGSEAKCEEHLCCRSNNTNVEKAGVQIPAAYWGTIARCDLPYWTAEDMLQQITKTHTDIDYVVVSGDLESHADWAYNTQDHAYLIQNVSGLLRKYFPSTKVYFALGNHEGVPDDNIAPHWVPQGNLTYQLYNVMANAWDGWVPDDQEAVVKYRGCYMVKLYPGLRLISFNTLYGDPNNFFLLLNQTDPDGTMSWLIEQLAIAEYEGDKVQIVAHIPGSDGEAYEGWAINYYNAVNRFEDTIVGQFFGHTHSEQYYMTYADPEDHTSRPTSVIFSAPSATPYSKYNPGYRIYTIDGNYTGSTYQVLDFEEWYFNLTAHGNDNHTTWEQLFASAKTAYRLKNMSASEWNNLTERMRNDDTLFQTYLRHFYRRDDVKRPDLVCNATCKADYICNIRKAHHTDNLCKDLGITKEVQKPILYQKQIKYTMPNISTREEALILIRKIQEELKGKGKDADQCEI